MYKKYILTPTQGFSSVRKRPLYRLQRSYHISNPNTGSQIPSKTGHEAPLQEEESSSPSSKKARWEEKDRYESSFSCNEKEEEVEDGDDGEKVVEAEEEVASHPAVERKHG